MSANRTTKIDSKLKFILLLCAIFIVLGMTLAVFSKINNERITEQNTEYLQSSTIQTVDNLSTQFYSSLKVVESIAKTYAATLENDNINVSDLTYLLEENTSDYDFSNFVFATSDGFGHDGTDRSAPVTMLQYYIDGMKGNSGFCYQTESILLNKKNLLAFYSPIVYKAKVVGVLCGFYDADAVSKMLRTSFFGENTSTYLLDTSGTILGSYTTSNAYNFPSNNFIKAYEEFANETNVSSAKLQSALTDKTYLDFTFPGHYGNTVANVMGVPGTEWNLLSSFPSSVTAEMSNQSNFITIISTAIVGGAAILIACILLLRFSRQRKYLECENAKSVNIINASVNLFSGLVLVDLEKNTYQILQMALDTTDLPSAGEYNMLRYYLRDLFFEDDRQTMDRILTIKGLRSALSGGTKYAKYEYRMLKNPKLRANAETNSNLTWMQLYITTVEHDARGSVGSVLLVFQDINKIKTKELSQHKMIEEALVAAERASEAKSDFLNNMSHDIRTPLNSIMGLVTIASVHVDDPSFVRDSLGKIQIASRHLLGLINEVLDMAKIESGNFTLVEEPFNIRDSIDDLLAIIEPQAEDKHQVLSVEIDDLVHEDLIGDPMRIQQVLVNIMSNSVKFTPESGQIKLEVHELNSKLADYGCYKFIISDTGCGMTEEFVERVFEPFSRANDTRVTKAEGTGLGMSIVKNVVNMMSGNIVVNSKVDEGSTFTITLHILLDPNSNEDNFDENEPLDLSSVVGKHVAQRVLKESDISTEDNIEAEIMSHKKDSEIVEDTSFAGRKILLVEDNFLAAEITTELLELLDVEVDRAENGLIALNKVKTGNKYDLIFMDVQMPVMNGYEATREIREFESSSGEHTPIVALTADAFIDDVNKALAAGMDSHVSKPVEATTLIAHMREYF